MKPKTNRDKKLEELLPGFAQRLRQLLTEATADLDSAGVQYKTFVPVVKSATPEPPPQPPIEIDSFVPRPHARGKR